MVKAIMGLPKDQWYEYISSTTRTQVRVVSSAGPEGPIIVERRNPTTGAHPTRATLSSAMIWRIANAYAPNIPINFDRVLAGSYNTRSLLEALLAHTPEFYWCTPGRIELINNSSEIKKGHKHIIWMPNTPHENGVLVESSVGSDQAISEIPTQTVTYDSLAITRQCLPAEMDIDVKRRHLQIQIALIEIGVQLGFRTWIAHNDKGFLYGKKRVGELEGVISSLSDEKVLAAYDDARSAANLIDCIWFKNGRLMPAVMEVEHSTGVTSGLTRMKKFQDLAPRLADIRWVIVAADEDRDDVIRKASAAQFQSLNTKFFSYSGVEELYSLCKRRNLSGAAVNEVFLDCFMEPCVHNQIKVTGTSGASLN
ncbi:restriction endonuclease [Polynucleobacter sp. AP-RePozz3-80-G7]|nr:restriction endonuclease [Polynucleobacter sp. AP-RePozz3-80-G7]